MDWHTWITQTMPASAIQRGGATVWPKGGKGLIGDSLGPIMHLHDGASEIFYFVSGRCRLEVGNTETIYGPGDFVLVPPEVPHNLWNAGDEDLAVFWIVAPNFIDNKWRTDGFPPDAMERQAFGGRVEQGASLPSDANISSQLLSLPRGEHHAGRMSVRQEAAIYVVEGQAVVTVGDQATRLEAHQFTHVPATAEYVVAAESPALSFIIFEMRGA